MRLCLPDVAQFFQCSGIRENVSGCCLRGACIGRDRQRTAMM